MRKILSGFLATAMVASVCATMTLAAAPATGNVYKIDMSKVVLETTADDSGVGSGTIAAKGATITLTATTGGTLVIKSHAVISYGDDAKAIAAAFAGASGSDEIVITNLKYPDAASTAVAVGDVTVTANNGVLTITTSPKGKDKAIQFESWKLGPKSGTASTLEFKNAQISMSQQDLAHDPISNTVDVDSDSNLAPEQVLVCDLQGNPLALVKDGAGTEKQINDDGGVQSDNKVYFMIQDSGYNPSVAGNVPYGDDKYFKIKVNKGDNAKQVKSISVVEKNVSGSNLIGVESGRPVAGTSGRHRFIEVALNPNYTTDEFKLTFDVRVTPTTSAVDRNYASDSDELKIRDFSVWMKNIERDADNDWKVGINGLMLKPLSNDWNDVTWFDEDGDLAHMRFFADSDVDSFYSKLSTKWVHADYASYFNDQDAYIFDFTGSPKLSATSRADLEIYNPFVDEDGNETIDPSSAVVYQVIDGDLFDVTDNFSYEEAESGDMAFKTRTRFLGTYIICEKPVEEAADTEAPETDLVPEEAPSEVTPDGGSNDGGKAPANTGKYL